MPDSPLFITFAFSRELAIIMQYFTSSLPNGLRVLFIPSTSPVVYCGYQIAVGSRNEAQSEEGLAHFCEHVTFKGTQKRRSWNIINCLESVGGDLNAFTNKEDTVYYAAVLKEHMPRAIDLLTDIVFHSTYPQREIDKEVEVICDEIESYNDSPSELIYDEFENMIFRGHPLGHNILGTAHNVRSFTTADAQRFTSQFYRPQNAVFFIHGNVKFERVLRLLEKATSDLPTTAAPVCTPLTPLNYQPEKRIVDRHTHQAHVITGCKGYAAGSKQRMALYIINNMLGGTGMNARLNVSLRERRGLVYTVESSMVSYGDTGLWCTYLGCDSHDVQRCLRLVRRELNLLMERPLTERQLLAAKKQIKGQIGIARDNRESLTLDMGKSFLHEGQPRDVDDLLCRVDRVTADDILAVAREVFNPEAMSTLIYE